MENKSGMMDPSIKACGKMISFMDLENMNSQMGEFIKGNGSMGRWKDLGSKVGSMASSSWDILKITSKMDLEF